MAKTEIRVRTRDILTRVKGGKRPLMMCWFVWVNVCMHQVSTLAGYTVHASPGSQSLSRHIRALHLGLERRTPRPPRHRRPRPSLPPLPLPLHPFLCGRLHSAPPCRTCVRMRKLLRIPTSCTFTALRSPDAAKWLHINVLPAMEPGMTHEDNNTVLLLL